MLEFIQTYGVQLLTGVVALGSFSGALVSLSKLFKTERRLSQSQRQASRDIQITREGIVEAFKTAKISPEWKVSIDKSIDAKLENWSKKFLTMFKEHEDLRTKLALANTKILAYTAAFDKLSKIEQDKLRTVIAEAEGDKNIIEV